MIYQKWSLNNEKNRKHKANKRSLNERWLFLCCGESTEIDYVKKVLYIIKADNKLTIHAKVFKSDNNTGIKKAIENIERRTSTSLDMYKKVIIIMDLEGIPTTKTKPFYDVYQKIDKEYIQGKNISPKFQLVYSLPSIEYWFLLHINTTSGGLNNATDVIKALKSTDTPFHNYDKHLSEKQISFLIDNYNKALNNMKHINSSEFNVNNNNFKAPYTQMDSIVKEIVVP